MAADDVLAREVIDGLHELGEMTPGGRDQLRSLVDLFAREADQRIERLSSAVAQSDVATVTAIAHSLAGSAANLGAHRVAALARGLETAAGSQTGTVRAEHVTALADELRTAVDALRAEFGAPP